MFTLPVDAPSLRYNIMSVQWLDGCGKFSVKMLNENLL